MCVETRVDVEQILIPGTIPLDGVIAPVDAEVVDCQHFDGLADSIRDTRSAAYEQVTLLFGAVVDGFLNAGCSCAGRFGTEVATAIGCHEDQWEAAPVIRPRFFA